MQPITGPTIGWRQAASAFWNSRTNLRMYNPCGCRFLKREEPEMSTAARPAVRNQIEAALAMHSAGRNQEALDALTTPNENLPDFYTLRGDVQFALGRYGEAAGSYFTSATLEPPP